MTPKPHPADRQPSLALRLAKWTVVLPILAVTGVTVWVRRWFGKPRTEAELRTDEKQRQRQIKRELRGLTPESPAKRPRRRSVRQRAARH
jgi:hypothetical protein